jgi:bacteriocin biosynthesis cyclodehydratase domain-containing protein
MSECLYISPLAEVTTLSEDKMAISVVGRRFTVEDRVGILKSILADAAQGVTVAQLVADRAESFPPEAVEVAVNALIEAKVLIKANGRNGSDATFHHLQHRREQEGLIHASQRAQYDKSNWAVTLVGSGSCADALAASLTELDVPFVRGDRDTVLSAPGERRALLLVCSDFDDMALFRAMNAKAVEANLPALFVGIDWNTVHCGPLVLPKATGCYECYFHRVRATRKFVAEFDVRSQSENILYHALPSRLAVQFGVAEASRVALQFLAGTLEGLQHSIFSEIDCSSGEIQRSRVLRLPRCQACGTASTARPVASVFQQALLRRRA